MAQKTTVHLVDDLDGGEAAETIAFALDGTNYEIDLSSKNADKLRSSVEKFVTNARSVKTAPPAGHRTTRTRRTSRAASGPTPIQIREWAGQNGIAVSARGRVAQTVIDQYQQAHSN